MPVGVNDVSCVCACVGTCVHARMRMSVCVRAGLEWMNGSVYGWMEGSGCQKSDLFCYVEMSAEFKKCSAMRDGATAVGKGTCTGHVQIRVVRLEHKKGMS